LRSPERIGRKMLSLHMAGIAIGGLSVENLLRNVQIIEVVNEYC